MIHTDVMLDLETLGTAPGSVILSIGAVAFTPGVVESEWLTFDAKPIKVRSSRAIGLTIDEGTLAWWLRQSDEARGLLESALDGEGGFTLGTALADFSAWLPTGVRLWGNGANFDNVLLRCAYTALGYTAPWPYYADCCFRTMKNMFKSVQAPEFVGVKHDALADALHQTRWLQSILEHIREMESAAK